MLTVRNEVLRAACVMLMLCVARSVGAQHVELTEMMFYTLPEGFEPRFVNLLPTGEGLVAGDSVVLAFDEQQGLRPLPCRTEGRLRSGFFVSSPEPVLVDESSVYLCGNPGHPLIRLPQPTLDAAVVGPDTVALLMKSADSVQLALVTLRAERMSDHLHLGPNVSRLSTANETIVAWSPTPPFAVEVLDRISGQRRRWYLYPPPGLSGDIVVTTVVPLGAQSILASIIDLQGDTRSLELYQPDGTLVFRRIIEVPLAVVAASVTGELVAGIRMTSRRELVIYRVRLAPRPPPSSYE